ncbi:MAG: DUF4159 domain-containing protein [Rhodospirillales bacterium]
MLSLGALSFAAPWALAALALLPALWWLLRVMPPSPRRVVFPPLRLLATLAARDETAVRTPWWLLLLRLALVACLILGIARPLLNADATLAGTGPVYILIDNGWGAGEGWPQRIDEALRTIDRAERQGRSVVLAATAPPAAESTHPPPPALLPAARARELAQALIPSPWPTDRPATLAALLQQANAGHWPPGAVIWISDGLDEPHGGATAAALLERMAALGPLTVLLPGRHQLPLLITPAERRADGPQAAVARATDDGERPVALHLIGDDGAPLAVQTGQFADGERRIELPLNLPTELAGRLAQVEIDGASTAGGVLVVDERWQRRAVGLLGEGGNREQPLLGSHYYLQRALQPFAEVRQGDLATLLARPLAALVMTDVGTPDAATAAAIEPWVEKGGVLLRFAGPRLAREASVSDPLLPVALRAGDRTIGGALSWTGVGKPAPFPATSPLSGIAVPDDLEIRRQVIAEPSLDVAERTWARLEDGTPLITGVRRGDGWVVLVHTTAQPDWSNLPLSGLFVDVLRRIVGLAAGGSARTAAASLPPLETLDGFGRLQAPPPGTRAIDGPQLSHAIVAPGQPPGFYGSPEARFALNLGPTAGELKALPPLSAGIRAETIGENGERDLQPALLTVALLLAVADLALSLAMRGMLRWKQSLAGTAAVALLLASAAAMLYPAAAAAQTVIADGTAPPAALSTRLAFVRTGDPRADQVSAAGLLGLSGAVNRRTAAELGEPVGINPETDEIAFFPLLYWPIGDAVRPLSPQAARRLTDYMRDGGTIVFDTRGRGEGSDRAGLRELARALDLPPLVPVAEDHVLRRAYYLLTDLPGRRAGGTVWIESSGEHVNDGVSSVVAGSNDWAGAWAMDDAQRPLFAVTPGGERQREQAFRFGINLVMYVLTGNYKADQVHTSTILERLGP